MNTRRARGAALITVLILMAVLAVYAMRTGVVVTNLRHSLIGLERRQVRALGRLAKARYGQQASVTFDRPRRPTRPPSPPPKGERP